VQAEGTVVDVKALQVELTLLPFHFVDADLMQAKDKLTLQSYGRPYMEGR
jgi:hypothetical protein